VYGLTVSLLLCICSLIYASKNIMGFCVQVFMKLTVSSIMCRSHSRFHPYWTINVKNMGSNYFMPTFSYNYRNPLNFVQTGQEFVQNVQNLCSEGENAHHKTSPC